MIGAVGVPKQGHGRGEVNPLTAVRSRTAVEAAGQDGPVTVSELVHAGLRHPQVRLKGEVVDQHLPCSLSGATADQKQPS